MKIDARPHLPSHAQRAFRNLPCVDMTLSTRAKRRHERKRIGLMRSAIWKYRQIAEARGIHPKEKDIAEQVLYRRIGYYLGTGDMPIAIHRILSNLI